MTPFVMPTNEEIEEAHASVARMFGTESPPQRKTMQTTMTLYTIAANIRSLIDQSETGELTPEILEQLEALELDLETKADAYCALIREQTAVEAGYTSEIDRLTAGRRTAQNAIASLKDRLTTGLQLAGVKRVDGPRFKVWLQRGPGSVEVTALAEDLPTEFQRVKIEPDKAKIKEHLDAGNVLAGCTKHEGKESIRIK